MKSSIPGLLIAVLLVGPAANSAVVLDQSSEPNGRGAGSFTFDAPGFGRANTFTVGVAGFLHSVEIFASSGFAAASSPFVSFRILGTDGGVPVGGAAGSVVRAATSTYLHLGEGWFRFDLSAARLSISVGDVLAIEPIAAAAAYTGGGWMYSVGYPGGDDFFYNVPFSVDNWSCCGTDKAFRTYVETDGSGPGTVPEPGTLALLGLGLAGLGLSRRRRRVN